MILVINVLEDADHRAAIAERIAMLEWRDGRETAGSVARQVKRNEQAAMNSPAGRALQDELSQLVSDNMVVKAAAQPRRFSPVIISRTGVGGKYGAHVDNALMGRGAQRLRTDLSFTLFLTPPGEYEGGELVIHAAGMTQELKLLQAAIRLGHPLLVRQLQQHWLHTEPDLVVSLVPNFNKVMYEALRDELPGAAASGRSPHIDLQNNLIITHAVCVGEPFAADVVRAVDPALARSGECGKHERGSRT